MILVIIAVLITDTIKTLTRTTDTVVIAVIEVQKHYFTFACVNFFLTIESVFTTWLVYIN